LCAIIAIMFNFSVHQVQLFFVQLDGLETGWRHGVKRSRLEIDIPHHDFL
jgi:hypothetical protein